MGYFIDGQWRSGWYDNDDSGEFQRPETSFRETELEQRSGRYHLYVSWACPWAHRTLIVRSVLGLEEHIGLSVVDWFLDDDGWAFRPEKDGSTKDHLFDKPFMREVYLEADPRYSGRVTVPVFFDRDRKTIVNNESRELIRMLGGYLRGEREPLIDGVELAPEEHLEEIDRTLDRIYQPINNGVYRAGFASTQKAYDRAVNELFEALDTWEAHLEGRTFLVAERFTEADICLFTTLVRFDPVYHVHFKCSRKRIADYPNLMAFLRRIYELPGVKKTCRLDHIVGHYYASHRTINPYGVVAAFPATFGLDLDAPIELSGVAEG